MQYKQVNVLGVKIDDLSLGQAVDLVVGWLKNPSRHYIVTPNPEFIIAAQRDKEFKNVLNNADLVIPDGVGLKIGSDLENTIAGVDLLERLCKTAADQGFTTAFLGGKDGVALAAANCLQKKYPGLKVVFAEDGPEVNGEGLVAGSWEFGKNTEEKPKIQTTSPKSQIDILFVAFGQVKQEKWIAKNLLKIPVKVAMGVGGSFDEISGKVPRIPGWIQKMGFKWLARLILQPWRIKRQLALIKFVGMVLTDKR